MNIDNIALVRASNFIPIDGIVKPLSNVPYLCKKGTSKFEFKLYDLLSKNGILPNFDNTRMNEDGYYIDITSIRNNRNF